MLRVLSPAIHYLLYNSSFRCSKEESWSWEHGSARNRRKSRWI